MPKSEVALKPKNKKKKGERKKEKWDSPSANVLPLKPRSTEMLSSGSFTTLYDTAIKTEFQS